MRTVLIIVFDGVQSLDVTGPLEVFAHAPGYAITTASLGGGTVRTSSGLRITPDAALKDLKDLKDHKDLTTPPVEETARACGYGTPEAMRRAFLRALGVNPAEYRRRFRPEAHPEENHADRHPAL
jgi:transcriptional regulator GlxA family with amidase domain